MVVRAVPAIPIQESIDNMLRVRVFEIRRGNGGKFRTFAHDRKAK
jgi:hypothetical protein